MTLDEAIKRAEDVANEYKRMCETVHPAMQLSDYGKCAEEHRQLAEWLKDYKRLKEKEPYKVSEYDKDHIWYKGDQYISLRRFLEVKTEKKNEPCGDAISRQAVCRIVDDIRDCISVNGYLAFLERLKKLTPVNPQPHWIPCSKRLPDDYDRYLITTDYDIVAIANYGYTNDCPDEIAFYKWDDEEWRCWKPDVTAWMPLPTPYDPQERSDNK